MGLCLSWYEYQHGHESARACTHALERALTRATILGTLCTTLFLGSTDDRSSPSDILVLQHFVGWTSLHYLRHRFHPRPHGPR